MFPPYCGGPCTLLPNSYVKSAFNIAKNTNPGDFHDEDVLFTGIIRVKSGAPEPAKVNGIFNRKNGLGWRQLVHWLKLTGFQKFI